MSNDSNNPNTKIYIVCSPCGISANVLTCLEKYGKPPTKLAFDVSTYHTANCDWCGKHTAVTQTRDFFYPNFGLLKTYETRALDS